MPNRRQFLAIALMPSVAIAQEKVRVTLPPPAATVGMDVLQAFKARRSTREFSRKPLPREILSTLLWAGFGVNRPTGGGRTAPSAHGWREIDVFAALPDGLFRYDAPKHALELLAATDLRGMTGPQDFVGNAPLNLVYVADYSRMTGASEEERTFFAATDAAVIAQNVYLYCAAAGLATVVRGWVDRKALAAAMHLRPDQRIVLAQTVGFPAA